MKMKLIAGAFSCIMLSVSGISRIHSLTINEFLASFEQILSAAGEYQCRITQWSAKDGKAESKIMNYYFAPPRKIRVDVIEGSRGAGTTGVLTEDGQIEAVPNVPLVRPKFVFELEHPMVTTNRGRTFDEASLPGIFESLSRYAETCEVSVELSEDAIVVVIANCPDRCDTIERMRFDSSSLLPVDHRVFESGMVVEHVMWTNFSLGTVFPEELFNVKLRQSRVANVKNVRVANAPISALERSVAESGKLY